MNIEEARALYVGGDYTYKQIAERYGVSMDYIARIARREGWRDQRKSFQKGIVEEALSRLKERGTKKLEELTEATNKMCGIMEQVASDPEQFYRWVGREGEVILKKADTRAMRDFASTLNDMIHAIRDLYGIPGILEERKDAREERRLQLLEKNNLGVSENQSGVVILPQVLLQVDEGVQEVD